MILAPKSLRNTDCDNLVWVTAETNISETLERTDAKDLALMLHSICHGNPIRAAGAIANTLKKMKNETISDIVKVSVFQPTEIEMRKSLVTESIHASIQSHTSGAGSCTAAVETFVKNVATASMYKIVQEKVEVSNYEMAKVIGTTAHQVSIARETVKELIDNNSVTKRRERQTRKDRILEKIQPYVMRFLLDDKYTRLDSKQGLEEVIDYRLPLESRLMVTIHRRIAKCKQEAAAHTIPSLQVLRRISRRLPTRNSRV